MFRLPIPLLNSSPSSMLNKNGCKKYVNEVFSPIAKSDNVNLLLPDHSGPFTDKLSFCEWMETCKKVLVENMPKNCIIFAQPFDAFGFLPIKDYARRFVHSVKIFFPSVKMYLRDNQRKFLFLLMNQFLWSLYFGLFQYVFYKADQADYIRFTSPVKFAFWSSMKLELNCSVENCNTVEHIKCSWCKELFYLQHFYIKDN